MKSIQKKYYLLSFLLVITTFTSIRCEASESAVSKVIAGGLPNAGTDAYWAQNPSNPKQKILLVPTVHILNLRFISPGLVEMIKSFDVLIVEKDIKELMSWDDATMLSGQLPKVELLKEYRVVNTTQILVKGKPWTSYLKPSTKEFLTKGLQSHLKQYTLDNLHPVIVMDLLTNMGLNKIANVGMDRQIYRDFDLKQKPILFLETLEETMGITPLDRLENLEDRAGISPDNPEIYQNIEALIKRMKLIDVSAPKSILEETKVLIDQMKKEFSQGIYTEMPIAQRHKLWMPKMVDYFNKYGDKSIVAAVGILHFPGPEGILARLSKPPYNFIITPFVEGEVTPKPVIQIAPGSTITAPSEQKTVEQATSEVDAALSRGLPQVVEYDRAAPKSALEIRAELINEMVRLMRMQPPVTVSQKRYELLQQYIQVRNSIFTDEAIQNKPKALEILARNPSYTIDQVKAEIR